MGEAMEVVAELTATVLRVAVSPGDAVRTGDVLAVLEAMKMEIPVESPLDGTVAEVGVREGDVVNEGTKIAIVR